MRSVNKKNQRPKISCYCPFKRLKSAIFLQNPKEYTFYCLFTKSWNLTARFWLRQPQFLNPVWKGHCFELLSQAGDMGGTCWQICGEKNFWALKRYFLFKIQSAQSDFLIKEDVLLIPGQVPLLWLQHQGLQRAVQLPHVPPPHPPVSRPWQRHILVS